MTELEKAWAEWMASNPEAAKSAQDALNKEDQSYKTGGKAPDPKARYDNGTNFVPKTRRISAEDAAAMKKMKESPNTINQGYNQWPEAHKFWKFVFGRESGIDQQEARDMNSRYWYDAYDWEPYDWGWDGMPEEDTGDLVEGRTRAILNGRSKRINQNPPFLVTESLNNENTGLPINANGTDSDVRKSINSIMMTDYTKNGPRKVSVPVSGIRWGGVSNVAPNSVEANYNYKDYPQYYVDSLNQKGIKGPQYNSRDRISNPNGELMRNGSSYDLQRSLYNSEQTPTKLNNVRTVGNLNQRGSVTPIQAMRTAGLAVPLVLGSTMVNGMGKMSSIPLVGDMALNYAAEKADNWMTNNVYKPVSNGLYNAYMNMNQYSPYQAQEMTDRPLDFAD